MMSPQALKVSEATLGLSGENTVLAYQTSSQFFPHAKAKIQEKTPQKQAQSPLRQGFSTERLEPYNQWLADQ